MASSSEQATQIVGSTSPGTTLCAAFQATAARRGDAIALRSAAADVELTWNQYAEHVRALAAGLAAHGVARGGKVALMMANRPEAHLVDTAALHLGAAPFSVPTTASPAQIKDTLASGGCGLVITEWQFADRVLEARASWPALMFVFVVEGPSAVTAGLEELMVAGEPDFDFDTAWRSVTGGDIASLIYSPDPSGPVRSIALTHEDVLAHCRGWLDETGLEPDGLMSYRPAVHLPDRVRAHYLAMISGACITCMSEPRARLA